MQFYDSKTGEVYDADEGDDELSDGGWFSIPRRSITHANLTTAQMHVFLAICDRLQPSGSVKFSPATFIAESKKGGVKISRRAVFDALRVLCERNFLVRVEGKRCSYSVNPHAAFTGNSKHWNARRQLWSKIDEK